MSIPFKYNDGGRLKSGRKGLAKDCVCRAISITSNRNYDTVYKELANINKQISGRKSARDGIMTNNKLFKNYMTSIGYQWIPCMSVGTGCKVHLIENELPKGNIIVKLSRHFSAIIDGVINDTYDCSRNGKRCVYGYYVFNK